MSTSKYCSKHWSKLRTLLLIWLKHICAYLCERAESWTVACYPPDLSFAAHSAYSALSRHRPKAWDELLDDIKLSLPQQELKIHLSRLPRKTVVRAGCNACRRKRRSWRERGSKQRAGMLGNKSLYRISCRSNILRSQTWGQGPMWGPLRKVVLILSNELGT